MQPLPINHPPFTYHVLHILFTAVLLATTLLTTNAQPIKNACVQLAGLSDCKILNGLYVRCPPPHNQNDCLSRLRLVDNISNAAMHATNDFH
eukprot:3878545-Rhodomonas_salina.1